VELKARPWKAGVVAWVWKMGDDYDNKQKQGRRRFIIHMTPGLDNDDDDEMVLWRVAPDRTTTPVLLVVGASIFLGSEQ
jgi:hypothetical protein